MGLSPRVKVALKDVSEITPAISTISAGLVGYSAKGSVDEIKTITSDQQFINEYGEPDPSTGHYFHYAALGYLRQGNNLKCLRVANLPLYGGVNIMVSTALAEENAAITVGKSVAEFDVPSGMKEDVLFQIIGTNPGIWNNKLGVVIQNVKTGSDDVPTDQCTFEILVYQQDDDGNWKQVEDAWKVSRKSKLDGFGKQLYLEDKINGASAYIRVYDNTDIADTALPKTYALHSGVPLTFAEGSDGGEISSSKLITGWNLFANPNDVDVRLLIAGGETDDAVLTEIASIAADRQDCRAILDMPWSSINSVDDMVTFRLTTLATDSCFSMLSGAGWGYVYDRYNDMALWIPLSGHVAGRIVYTIQIANSWTSPAGPNRGILDEVLKTPKIFTDGEMNTLCQSQINPIQWFPGKGAVLWDMLTLQRKESALSDTNVVGLFIEMQKTISISLHDFLQENNTETTRFRVTSLLNEYLERLSNRGAFQTEGGDSGYLLVCDDTNNTADVIDRHELRVDLFIKPVRAIKYINFTVIITRTGVKFSQLVARGIAAQ